MTSTDHLSATLTWQVFTSRRPGLGRDLPAGYESLAWVANSATLIAGRRDAVLVDTFLTIEQNRVLADAIAAAGRELTHIYVTHAHGDHFFGIEVLRALFPDVRAVATPAVVAGMERQVAPELLEGFWRRLFPGELPERPAIAEPLGDGVGIDLEGHALVPIETGFTDTGDSTSLHAPAIGLVAAGDVVYNGIHPFLGETDPRTRQEWIAALDTLEALAPTAVVAGHKIPENADSPRDIERTRQYLRDFDRLVAETDTARALFDAMIALHPERANPGSLWGAAVAAKPPAAA